MTEIKPTLQQLYEGRKALVEDLEKEMKLFLKGRSNDVTTIIDLRNRIQLINSQIKEQNNERTN